MLSEFEKKWTSAVRIACALAALGVAFACGDGTAPEREPPPVVVTSVVAQDVPVTAEWVGTTDGFNNAGIRPKVKGYLLSRDYDQGTVVEKGKLLFQIDPRQFQAELDNALGQLGQARAMLGKSASHVKRYRPLAADGAVTGIAVRQRLDSHKLIEEFMIAANVAAAETLEKVRKPCMYRVHDEPSAEKVAALRDALDSVGITFAKGGVASPKRFNQVLKQAVGTAHAEMVNVMVLRTQAQAEYGPGNLGHFGLALRRYCHFTSPIRRYADLIVHRALIDAVGLGEGGQDNTSRDIADAGKHLSNTERRAAGAERDAVDRYTAGYLADRVGAVFSGRVNGVTRFGLFVTLIETGADGLVPIRTLADDYYVHDESRHSLRGRRGGREYRLGQTVEVRLTEANPITGGMIFALTGNRVETGDPAPEKRKIKGKPERKPGRKRSRHRAAKRRERKTRR